MSSMVVSPDPVALSAQLELQHQQQQHQQQQIMQQQLQQQQMQQQQQSFSLHSSSLSGRKDPGGHPGHSSHHAGASSSTSVSAWSMVDQFACHQAIVQVLYEVVDRIRKDNPSKHTSLSVAHIPSHQQHDAVLSTSNALALHSLFGSELERALNILDDGKVVGIYVGNQSNRWFARIKGSSGNEFYVTTQFHCNCLAYQRQVVVENSHLFCKHQLAAILAEALRKAPIFTLSDAEIGKQLEAGDALPKDVSGRGFRRQ